MESDQVHVVTRAVPGDAQQVLATLEPRLARQIVGDILERDRCHGIHDDVAVVHTIAAAHLHVRSRPDAHAACDPPAFDALAKFFGEHHRLNPTGRRDAWRVEGHSTARPHAQR